MVIYLMRHGRTALNAQGQLRGRLDPSLDEVGIGEAQALGRAFADIDVAAVVSSPLRRARQTADPIAASRQLTVKCDDRLIDRDYGPWAGKTADELLRRFGSIDDAPGVEPRGSLSDRALDAVMSLANSAGPRPVAVVAHDVVNRLVISRLVPEVGAADSIPQRTGCLNRLECLDGRWSAPIVDAIPSLGPSE